MSKVPFSIRVETRVTDKFKALTTILNIDGAQLLEEMVKMKVESLTENQRIAYDALLIIWKENEQ